MREDNYIRTDQKARWGFSGTSKEIKVATETVGETGGAETLTNYEGGQDEAARNNGGGTESKPRATKKAEADKE